MKKQVKWFKEWDFMCPWGSKQHSYIAFHCYNWDMHEGLFILSHDFWQITIDLKWQASVKKITIVLCMSTEYF